MGSRRCKRRESSEDWPLRAGEAAGPAHIRWRVVAGRGGSYCSGDAKVGLGVSLTACPSVPGRFKSPRWRWHDHRKLGEGWPGRGIARPLRPFPIIISG